MASKCTRNHAEVLHAEEAERDYVEQPQVGAYLRERVSVGRFVPWNDLIQHATEHAVTAGLRGPVRDANPGS